MRLLGPCHFQEHWPLPSSNSACQLPRIPYHPNHTRVCREEHLLKSSRISPPTASARASNLPRRPMSVNAKLRHNKAAFCYRSIHRGLVVPWCLPPTLWNRPNSCDEPRLKTVHVREVVQGGNASTSSSLGLTPTIYTLITWDRGANPSSCANPSSWSENETGPTKSASPKRQRDESSTWGARGRIGPCRSRRGTPASLGRSPRAVFSGTCRAIACGNRLVPENTTGTCSVIACTIRFQSFTNTVESCSHWASQSRILNRCQSGKHMGLARCL